MTPASDARLNANRENAQHSTGPKTPEGKSRARLNGLRHGLTGQTVVMPDEDRALYDAHVARLIEALQPEGILEIDLAQAIADDKWRLNRIRAIEQNMFICGAESTIIPYHDADEAGKAALLQAEAFLRFPKEFQLLTLYESRINRSLKNNTAELTRLQTERKAEQARQLEEAALLAELAESEGESFSPAEHGFAFSAAELTRHRTRIRRLAQARALSERPKTALKKAA